MSSWVMYAVVGLAVVVIARLLRALARKRDRSEGLLDSDPRSFETIFKQHQRP